MSEDTPWVIVHGATKGDKAYALECRRCGGIQRVVLPMSMSIYLAMGKEFIKIHRDCKEPESTQ